jgi:hypothetical protein
MKRRVPDSLQFEPSESFEEGATFAALDNGGLLVSVSEEKAVDSYNASFECNMTMTPMQVRQLRDWLNAKFG